MRKHLLPVLMAGLVCTGAVAEKPRVMVLAGGHLPVCSSMNLDACAADQRERLRARWQQESARFDTDYDPGQLSNDALPYGVSLAPERERVITAALNALQTPPYRRADIEAALAQAGVRLSEDEAYWLYDRLPVETLDDHGMPARIEQLDLAATDPRMREIFVRFVEASRQAGQRKPRIGFLTSAARDVTAAVEFYHQLFVALGAEPVWLPLDPASRILRDNQQAFSTPDPLRPGKSLGHCDRLYRERARQSGVSSHVLGQSGFAARYCENVDLVAELKTLDGLFFNGGDQTLHLRSLLQQDGQDSAELAIIRQRYQRGELVLMGTSAGTAVQSGNATATLPMISNGETAHALQHPAIAQAPRLPFCQLRNDCPLFWHPDQLRYRPQGGLRLFPYGVLDTHFTERGRQGRLLMLLAQTQTQQQSAGRMLGFGVDEATALVVSSHSDQTASFDVIGRGGVWIIEKGAVTVPYGSSHYLIRGDRAALHDNRLDLALQECVSKMAKVPAELTGERLLAGVGVHEAALQLASNKTPLNIRASDQSAWSFVRGINFALCPKADGRWSYRNMMLHITSPASMAGAAP